MAAIAAPKHRENVDVKWGKLFMEVLRRDAESTLARASAPTQLKLRFENEKMRRTHLVIGGRPKHVPRGADDNRQPA